MASKWWKESSCWEKLGNLDIGKALRVLKYCHKVTVDEFLKDLSRLSNETSINGKRLKSFVTRHKPIISLILCHAMPFDKKLNGEVLDMSSRYERICTKDSVFLSVGFHIQFCECFLLSVLGRQGAWRCSLKNISLDGDSFPLSRDEVVALCANLSSNSNLRSLDLRNQELFRSQEGCRLLGQALRMNSSLEKLFLPSTNLTSKGVEQLMYGLAGASNTNLKVLDMGMNDKIGDIGIHHIAKMLENNQTLKILHLRGTGCGFEGARLISSALLVNSSLELLSLGSNPVTVEGMKLLLSPLTPILNTAGEYRSNSTLKHLELEYLDATDFSVESLCMMIRSNKTLESLNITGVLIGERDWIHKVIPALYENNTLKYLAISGSNVLPLDALMEQITSLSGNSNTLRAGVKNGEFNINRQFRSELKAQRRVGPKLGRIIVCGYKFSGKTTICKTMRYLVDGPPAFHHCNVAWKKIRKKVILVRKSLFGTHALAKPENQTRGCAVVRLRNEPHRRTYVWDFAGQKECYALHKTLSSNFSNSCFLYVCSAVFHVQTCGQSRKQGGTRRRIKNQQDIQKELEYWIRFIVGDSRPFVSGTSEYAHRPRFIFVLTNKDELDEVTLHYITRSAEHAVAEMKQRYRSIVDLQEIVTVVDSHSCQDVHQLIRLAEESVGKVFQQSTESAACEQVRRVLEKWSVRNASKPFLGMADFRTLCDEELGANLDRHAISAAKLHSAEGQVTVLNHLNSLGDIIFPSSHDLIVVNPRTFALDILGSIIEALNGARLAGECEGALGFCGTCLNPADHEMGLHHEKGFVRGRLIKEIADRLKHVSSTQFLNLLIHLELCFETTTGTANENKYAGKFFVPAVFDDEEETAVMGRRQLKWTENMHRHDFYYVYIGRRLGCDANDLTVFTPGFFPRLQVFLHNYCMAKEWLDNQAFQMDRNLFGFYENGVEVLVEYSGAVGFFVDILVKSSWSFPYALDFIQVNVIQKIQQLCSSDCPGVVLVESVIRPLCVKDLHLCVDRINQTVPISSVHDRVKENGYNYKLAWPESIHRVSDVEKAVELLGEDCPLLTYSNPLVREADNSMSSNAQISTLLDTREDQDRPQSGSSAVNTALKNTVERELDTREITSQSELERRLPGDAQYEQKRPVTSTEQHLPSRFYPTNDDVGYLSSLWARIEAKKAVKIHLMCESPSGSHYVPEQQGRILNLRTGRSSVMEHILTFVRQGLAGTAQFAGMDVEAGWFQGLFGTSSNMPIKIEDLLRITDRCNTSAPISDDEILSSLSMYLQVERSTEWLRDFLNMENGNAFRHDFELWKVKDLNTDSIAWVCVAHYMQALRQQNQLSIPP